jgi:hypothetical protein
MDKKQHLKKRKVEEEEKEHKYCKMRRSKKKKKKKKKREEIVEDKVTHHKNCGKDPVRENIPHSNIPLDHFERGEIAVVCDEILGESCLSIEANSAV